MSVQALAAASSSRITLAFGSGRTELPVPQPRVFQTDRVEFWDSQASWTLPPTSAHHCKPQFFLRNSWVLGLLPTAKSNPFTRCELTLHHPKLHRCMCHGRTTRSSLDHRLVVNLHHAYVTKQSRYLLLRKNMVLERGLATRLAPADQSCWNIW